MNRRAAFWATTTMVAYPTLFYVVFKYECVAAVLGGFMIAGFASAIWVLLYEAFDSVLKEKPHD